MSAPQLLTRLRELCKEELPLPGRGKTRERHLRLAEIGREDLSLARLAEAHYDACSILAEAGREPASGMLYGVWAAEKPGCSLTLERTSEGIFVQGEKIFCSGAGIVDRALVTVEAPNPWLVELDLQRNKNTVSLRGGTWKAEAFRETNTTTVVFDRTPAASVAIIGDRGWYLDRPGFWHGACGPAACWAGGAFGLLDYARHQSRSDAHTLAHRGAMEAACWAMRAILEKAGDEIDACWDEQAGGRIRALSLRHVIEELCTGVLGHFGRALGPVPLALDEEIARRYQELTLYLRQSHAERDSEALGALSRL